MRRRHTVIICMKVNQKRDKEWIKNYTNQRTIKYCVAYAAVLESFLVLIRRSSDWSGWYLHLRQEADYWSIFWQRSLFREDHWTKICCFRSCIDRMMLQKKWQATCMKRVWKLKNMSSERTKVFSLLFAFTGKPRKTLGYKNQNPIWE